MKNQEENIQELREFIGDNKGNYFLFYDVYYKEWRYACVRGICISLIQGSLNKIQEAINHFGDRLNIFIPSHL